MNFEVLKWSALILIADVIGVEDETSGSNERRHISSVDWLIAREREREREREGAREREREQGPRYGTNMQMRWPTLRTSSPMTPSQPPVTLGFSLPYLWSITFLNSSVQTYNTWIQINNELIAESTPAGHHGTEFGKYIERGTECNTIWMSIAYHPASKRIKATNS